MMEKSNTSLGQIISLPKVVDPRGNLKRALRHMEELGFTAQLGRYLGQADEYCVCE